MNIMQPFINWFLDPADPAYVLLAFHKYYKICVSEQITSETAQSNKLKIISKAAQKRYRNIIAEHVC